MLDYYKPNPENTSHHFGYPDPDLPEFLDHEVSFTPTGCCSSDPCVSLLESLKSPWWPWTSTGKSPTGHPGSPVWSRVWNLHSDPGWSSLKIPWRSSGWRGSVGSEGKDTWTSSCPPRLHSPSVGIPRFQSSHFWILRNGWSMTWCEYTPDWFPKRHT